jgi:hypothetical protein
MKCANVQSATDGTLNGTINDRLNDRLSDRLNDRLNSREKRVLLVLSETPDLYFYALTSFD